MSRDVCNYLKCPHLPPRPWSSYLGVWRGAAGNGGASHTIIQSLVREESSQSACDTEKIFEQDG